MTYLVGECMNNNDVPEITLFDKCLLAFWVIAGFTWFLTSIKPTVTNDVASLTTGMISNPFYFIKILVVDVLFPKDILQWRVEAIYLDCVEDVSFICFIITSGLGVGLVLTKMTKTERIHFALATMCAVSAIAGLISYAHLLEILPQNFLISLLAIFAMLPATVCFGLIPVFLAHKVGLLKADDYNEVIRYVKLMIAPGDGSTNNKT
ncbi:hypothetical protein CRN52_12395 [Vibrio vulnificus]|uniref:Uncharacterized protein n=2 Tax=Vibrionaceae TaxID=641 RepID=A0A2S3R199_VIBVL|nr:hypothetical protein CRN52_12395 [Vibrio vulnificus]